MGASGTARAPDGRELAYCWWGPPDGAPVFWLHTTPGGRYLRHVNGEPDQVGARVITYDRPGYGSSTRSPGRSVADVAVDVRAIADELGAEQFAVAGVSEGGPCALAVAANLPDRVTRCATVNGVVPLDAEGLDVYAGMDEEDAEEWRCALAGEECVRTQLYPRVVALMDELAGWTHLPEAVRDMLVETLREGLAPGPHGYLDDWAALVRPWGFDLERVRCTTRVLIAREDTTVPPSHGQWLVAHLPRAEAVWVDGGHTGPRAEAELDLLAWLASPRSPAQRED